MTPHTRWIAGGAATLLVGVALGVGMLAIPAAQDAIFTRFVKQKLQTGSGSLLRGDNLKVLLCGTSAPFADPHRAQSCTAIIAGDKYYLVDTGPGSGRNLMLWQLRGRELGAVFLTHFHSDHIGDLGEVNTNAWMAGHTGSLQVFGGPGVDKIVLGFNQSYALDQDYRTQNSGVGLLPPAADVMQANTISMNGSPTAEKRRKSLPIHFGELTVTAIEVNHDPAEPAYGYRFDYRGRSAVVSGDTNLHPSLAVAADGADVLVHEAQSQHLVQLIQMAATQAGDTRIAQTMGDIQHYHTDPLDAARIANQAHVQMLVLTHLDPPVANLLLYKMFYRRMSNVRSGDWISGADGTLITLPVGSNQVLISQLKH